MFDLQQVVLLLWQEGPRLRHCRTPATILAAVWLIAVSITPSPASGQTAGLRAAYSFDEGSGSSVKDSSGNGNTGTILGATWTTGRFGKALKFNGTGALVTVNDSSSLDLTTGMTLEAWVYRTSSSARWRDVIYKGVDDIYYLEGSSPQGGAPAMGGTFSSSPLYGKAGLALYTWRHLAATYDGATMRLYVNGVQVTSRAQTGPIQTSTGALTIGGDSLYGQYWAGRIDEVRIYNRALSSSEIQSDMNTPVGPPPNQPPVASASATPTSGTAPLEVAFSSAGSSDPEGVALSYSWTFGDGSSSSTANPSHTYQAAGVYVARLTASDGVKTTSSSDLNITVSNPAGAFVAAYGFEEGNGGIVSDASGNGNTGTVSGATWTAGRFGSALEFNGTGALVTVNDSPSLDLTTMTLEAWVYPTSTAAQWKDVIYKGVDDIYYLEGSSPQGGAPAMGGTFGGSPLYGTAALPVNTWTHLAATYDGATMRLYVNAVQVASRAQGGPIQTSAGALTIGGDSLYGQYWAGRIDEVRIYNWALSQAEIQNDMSTPVAEPAPGPEPVPTPDPFPIPAPGPLLRLAWDPVTTDVQGNPLQIAGYRVYTAESGLDYRLASTTAQPSAELGNLPPATVCVIAVKAFDVQDTESEFSVPITVLMP